MTSIYTGSVYDVTRSQMYSIRYKTYIQPITEVRTAYCEQTDGDARHAHDMMPCSPI